MELLSEIKQGEAGSHKLVAEACFRRKLRKWKFIAELINLQSVPERGSIIHVNEIEIN